jgi:hypothetical protein
MFNNLIFFLNEFYWIFLMQSLSKYYKENYHDLKIFFLTTFMEYSKNKIVQKAISKGWVWFMLV